jgi:Rieske Fe-S protein
MNKEIEAPLPPRPAWNADFPIDRVEAQHVLRREFAKYLVFVSGGLAAGSGWVAVRDKLFPHQPITGEHLICRTQDVPVGGTRAFTVPGSTVPYILINLGNDEWHAFEQKCTHLSCAVFYQPKKERSNVPATTAGSTRGPALRFKVRRSGRFPNSSWKSVATRFLSFHRSTESRALSGHVCYPTVS